MTAFRMLQSAIQVVLVKNSFTNIQSYVDIYLHVELPLLVVKFFTSGNPWSWIDSCVAGAISAS